jgi:hypothetical protein
MASPGEPVRADLRLLSGEGLYDEVVVRGMMRAKEKVRIVTANLKSFYLDEANAFFDRIWSGEECDRCLRRRECPAPLEGIAF